MQCPHCLQMFSETNGRGQLEAHGRVTSPVPEAPDSERPKRETWWLYSERCPNELCKKMIVRLQRFRDEAPWLVYPKAISRTALSPLVPSDYLQDYGEACLVLGDSPNASAALSRRCFQRLLHTHFKIEKKTLYQEIGELLDKKVLPPELAHDIDAIREVGNNAAHPRKDLNTNEIYDVEPGEAEWLLSILEALFRFCFVEPVEAQARRDAFNRKLVAVGKDPLKTPKP